jgi:plastocyanin
MRCPMKPARAWLAAFAVPALVVFASGCGTGKRTRAEHGRIDLVMREYRLAPQRLEASAGRLVVSARNRGVLEHRLAIGRGRFALARSGTVPPGGAATLTVRLPPGRYRLFCTLSNHDTLGMYGSLVVR